MVKPLKNILRNWETYTGHGDMRIRGEARLPQDDIQVLEGDLLVTSPIIRIYRWDGDLYLETKNSRYILD